jgi:ethanolamine ammonia-lyase large subunit
VIVCKDFVVVQITIARIVNKDKVMTYENVELKRMVQDIIKNVIFIHPVKMFSVFLDRCH